MTTTQPASVLDYQEERFPLKLAPVYADIRDLWDRSNEGCWDPNTAIPWAKFDPSKYTREQLDAAALYWSRRAWTEYTGTAESPAVLLRLCLEPGRDIDARLFWAAQTFEETRHCVASYLFAETLGSYSSEPPIKPPANVMFRGIRDKVMNPAISFEAFVIAHICIGETIAAHLFEERYRNATDPVAKELVRLILKDEVRHIQFGWRYMAHKLQSFTPELVAEMERIAVDVIENSELKGFHCIWLYPTEANEPLIEANRICAEAGLGASSEAQERVSLIASIKTIRTDMAKWGITIPVFEHELLGTV
jgi:hypothetical protein